jgi:hypothetical protein
MDAEEKAAIEAKENSEERSDTHIKSLREHNATSKYLHEDDMAWCQINSKLGQKDIIKWFKRSQLIQTV